MNWPYQTVTQSKKTNTPRSAVLLDKKTVAQSAKRISRISRNAMLARTSHWTWPEPVESRTHPHNLQNCPSTYASPKWYLHCTFSGKTFICISSVRCYFKRWLLWVSVVKETVSWDTVHCLAFRERAVRGVRYVINVVLMCMPISLEGSESCYPEKIVQWKCTHTDPKTLLRGALSIFWHFLFLCNILIYRDRTLKHVNLSVQLASHTSRKSLSII
jgi:hypothetical protein